MASGFRWPDVKLGTRLALLSILTLSLPLAGWQVVRSLEHALRDSYQQALVDTARSVADEIAAQAIALPKADAIYVHEAAQAIIIDGYSSEWSNWLEDAQALPLQNDGSSNPRFVAAAHRGRLHLLVEVDDPQLVLARPDGAPGDRLELQLEADAGSRQLTISPLAPGWFSIRTTGPDVQAALQPRDRGWTMELALEQPIALSALGLRVIDVDDRDAPQTASVYATETPRPLARPSETLSRRLAALLPARTRGWVTAPGGWIVARAEGGAGRDQNADENRGDSRPALESADEGWLLATTAARLLGVLPGESPRRGPDQDRLEGKELGAQASASWYQLPAGDGFVVSAGAPVVRNGRVAGHVVIERPADRFMASAYRSLLQLFVFGLAGMLTLAVVLIGFAAWLSARIRRLRDAAESAVGSDGRVRAKLPAPQGSDEIADLGRSISNMVERQRQHQAYLQTLAGKLSHELRTPLAMIRSSLDNLSEVDDAASRERYRQRAEAGCLRLQRMFQAMSQAARIEESLADDPLKALDLGELVVGYVAGCRQAFRDHRFAAVVPNRTAARVLASAEQLAQLLDKLVENAVEFSPPASRITLRVVPQGPDISLQVDNPGSRLPEGPAEHLFESMVSSRSAGSEGAHLGLGLHIVRLIARRHGARLRALDLPDGVRFQVDFPKL